MSALVDEVDNCNTCPLSFRTDLRWWCMHPAHADRGDDGARKWKMSDQDIESGKTPDWCPLVSAPVLIRRKPQQLNLTLEKGAHDEQEQEGHDGDPKQQQGG